MVSNAQLLEQFYQAFQKKDFKTMQACYHEEARFSDPVFQDLNVAQVRAMWEMLLTSSTDLKLEYSHIAAGDSMGMCFWQARYTFSLTGRKVHNIIDAKFDFKDGKIYRHIDRFDFWRWSRMALGVSGWLLGWSPIVLNKVRSTARERLERFMSKGKS